MKRTPTPLVSFVLAAHDAARTIGAAVGSVLRQTVADLELLVVDDGSGDATPEILSRVRDRRLVVVRNEERLGLAASLNRGFETARGRFLARLDADDLAFPARIERQLHRMGETPGLAVLGSAVLELGARALGHLHEPPLGEGAVRWHALFSSPFFHPTVVLDRALLDEHDLRYDPAFEESEDYDLWTRILAVADGDNVAEPLVLRRVHPGQASNRRAELQRSLQRRVALREIERVAPDLSPDDCELAWRLGAGEGVAPGEAEAAAGALAELLERFVRAHRHLDAGGARFAAARAVARAARGTEGGMRAHLLRRALVLDPALPVRVAGARAQRRRAERAARDEARSLFSELGLGRLGESGPVRVVVVSPEPTPYRSPLFDRIARRPEVDLTVVYAARTVAGRTWEVEPRHRAVFLDGIRVPGVRRALRHDYPVTPGVFGALGELRPEVVVANGWSTFASQAAIAWSRAHRLPYLLLVSSHDAVERAWWRRAVRRPVVPTVVRGAWGAFALGELSRASLVEHGARADRVRLFANTVDVGAVGEEADRLALRRPELRAGLGLDAEDVAVLSVGRLVPEKGLDTLVAAVAAAGDPRLALVVAGEGPLRAALVEQAHRLGARLRLTGDLAREQLLETYVAADLFALLSTWEPWGVVVNEAAACGKPLLLSDQVGAAPDLLRDGENGWLVPAGDADAVGRALARLVADPAVLVAAGARSRELVSRWGYEPSVDSFVTTVCEAAGRRPSR